jgi:hypothetical protein
MHLMAATAGLSRGARVSAAAAAAAAAAAHEAAAAAGVQASRRVTGVAGLRGVLDTRAVHSRGRGGRACAERLI